jgi:3-phenylpropionate/cinnamic acid dioxygenase small subunit
MNDASETLFRVMHLNATYAAALDDGRLEVWPEFFVEDCIYKITSAENVHDGNEAGIVYADSRAMLADRVLALRRANIYERQSYRHIVGTPLLLEGAGRDLACETPFLVIRTMRDGRMDLFAAGKYCDRLREQEGGLYFAERMVVCDSSRFDTLLALPL